MRPHPGDASPQSVPIGCTRSLRSASSQWSSTWSTIATSCGVQNLGLAAFLLATTVEAVAHAAVLDRPKILRDEEFVAALGDLALRYLLD